ncbi:adenosylhomocysteinase [Kribbella turkmenica]|uniref:Adenosylhomocysteinase n=1 Tax=Kribbella turkmenica TaxID=2530375 RepID=A0A4R4XAU7_9ACTN|nr:NAD(P)-dependent oxidoreductase [Kribbella turkmenica]TDD27736.1 adenosylhomocysteinase [Kribbella turkmenica]
MELPTTAWQGIDLEQRLAWARRWMRRTAEAAGRLPDLTAVRLAVTAHLDLKSALFLQAYRTAGAAVIVHPADPATTRADVQRLVEAWGIDVTDPAACVAWEPTHTVEMGGDILVEAAARGYDGIVAGIEMTRTGLNRVAALALTCPVFDLDGVPLKNQLHNRFTVGTSTWHTVTARTQLSLHGLTVLVAGYGEVGAGLARTARGLGAVVQVAEVDPARALIASYDGFDVVGLAGDRADIVVTATGRTGTLSADVIGTLKDGCLIVNAGHSADEIDLDALGNGVQAVPAVTSHRVGGREILLFAGGHVANLAAGDGDSLNAFDVTAALIVDSAGWLVAHGNEYPTGLHAYPGP